MNTHIPTETKLKVLQLLGDLIVEEARKEIRNGTFNVDSNESKK